jgi:nicotinate phosphoribosyltransferase
MMNGYYKQSNKNKICVFDIFFRQNGIITYSIAAGLEQAVEYLLNLEFSESDIKYLKSLNTFDEGFLNYLKSFKFSGDMYSVPEGTLVFPGEPIVTIKAPIIEAQLIETALLNIINHQTLIATKASKICYAAGEGSVMEFGLRRAQGPDAGVYGARAAIIGGCSSTSNVLAGKKFNIPVSGTHSHSWVMNFDTELDAFRAYADTYPNACLLLVDTYDTLKKGVPNAIKIFNELKEKGYKPIGIRLDSGDLAYLSKKARIMLDDAGFTDTKICASGDLDENSISSLKSQGAKIDIWGVGTKLITSDDMPSLGGVYKLSAVYEGEKEIPKIKISDNAAKITNPCFKNIIRIYDKETNKAEADLIITRDEKFDESKPLTIFHPTETWKTITFTNYYTKTLHQDIIINGKLVYKLPELLSVKKYAKEELESFWDEYKRLDKPHLFKVDLSKKLFDIKNEMLKEIRGE